MQPRVGRPPKFRIGRKQSIGEAREIFLAKPRSLLRKARTLVLWRGDQVGFGAADAGDQQIAKMANRLAAEMLQILPVADQPMH